MVIDTACARAVHGLKWGRRHQKTLAKLGYKVLSYPEHEHFQFGAGEPQLSKWRRVFPAGVGGVALLLRSSEVNTHIPFLISRTVLDKLGAVVDLVKKLDS